MIWLCLLSGVCEYQGKALEEVNSFALAEPSLPYLRRPSLGRLERDGLNSQSKIRFCH